MKMSDHPLAAVAQKEKCPQNGKKTGHLGEK